MINLKIKVFKLIEELKKLIIEIFEKIEGQEFEKKKPDNQQDNERHNLIINKMMEKVNKIKTLLKLNE